MLLDVEVEVLGPLRDLKVNSRLQKGLNHIDCQSVAENSTTSLYVLINVYFDKEIILEWWRGRDKCHWC